MDTHGQVKLDGVNRFMEGPCKVVPPQRLEQDFLQKLKLVGHPPLSAGVFHWGLWGSQMGHLTDRRHPRTLKALIEQGRFSDSFSSCCRTLVHCDSHYANLNPDMRAAESRSETNQLFCTSC